MTNAFYYCCSDLSGSHFAKELLRPSSKKWRVCRTRSNTGTDRTAELAEQMRERWAKTIVRSSVKAPRPRHSTPFEPPSAGAVGLTDGPLCLPGRLERVSRRP